MAHGGDESMTLVLALSAVQRLGDPAAAIADASEWSRHVGVVGDDRPAVIDAVERAAADPDFVSGEAGMAGSLSAVRQRFATDRHVFVSAVERERATAQALGWEYLSLADAVAKADWDVDDEPAARERADDDGSDNEERDTDESHNSP